MITTKNIKTVSDLEIFKFYIPGLVIGQMILSPLRKERTPSFNVFLAKSGYRFKDFGTNDSGDGIEFVKKLFGLTYRAAEKKVSSDIESGLSSFIGFPSNYIEKVKQGCEIKIKIRKFTEQDLEYWNNYGISEKILKQYFVFSISHYWINDYMFTVPKGQLTFAYWNDEKYKIYSPYAKVKWMGNQSGDCLQGLFQIPEQGDLLLITKSLKDVMVLFSLGYNAVAPQSETVILSESIISDLKDSFKEIVVFFDNDHAGLLGASNYTKMGFKSIIIPVESGCKDISDFYCANFSKSTEELLKQLLN